MNYTQKSYVNGKWENMYPTTTAEQVTTDENHQFVTEEQIKEFSQKSQISIGATQPAEPKEGMIWFDTSTPVTEPTE